MLEAFGLRESCWVLLGTYSDDDPVSVAPFEAITIGLGDLWPKSEKAVCPDS